MSELRSSSEPVDTKKRECLKAYFDSGEACWETVVKALEKPPFMNGRLATKIIKNYKLRDEL